MAARTIVKLFNYGRLCNNQAISCGCIKESDEDNVMMVSATSGPAKDHRTLWVMAAETEAIYDYEHSGGKGNVTDSFTDLEGIVAVDDYGGDQEGKSEEEKIRQET